MPSEQPHAAPVEGGVMTWASVSPPGGGAGGVATAPAARAGFGAWDIVLLVIACASLTLIVLTRWYRLRRAPRRPEALTAVTAFALLCAMMVLSRLGAIIGAAALGIGANDPNEAAATQAATPSFLSLRDAAMLTLCAAIGGSLVLPVYAVLQKAARTPAPDMRFPPLRMLAVSVAALLLVWPIVASVGSLVGWLFGAPDEIAHSTLRELASGSFDRPKIMLALLAVVAAPVLEEVMYRGLLQEALIQVGLKRWPAIVLASVMFAVVHVGSASTHALPALFVLSLGFGWAYEKTGRLGASITMHALFNAGNLLLARIASSGG